MIGDSRDDAGPPTLGPATEGRERAEPDETELALAADGEEARTEGLAGAVEGDVDGAGGAAQLLGDLAAGVALGPQRESSSVSRVQLPQCSADEGMVHGVEHRVDDDVATGGVKGSSNGLALATVGADVGGDDSEPGIEAAVATEAGKGAVGLDQRLLSRLFGVVGIAEAALAVPAQPPEVALVQVGEGLLVAALEPLDERGVAIKIDVVGP